MVARKRLLYSTIIIIVISVTMKSVGYVLNICEWDALRNSLLKFVVKENGKMRMGSGYHIRLFYLPPSRLMF